MQCFIGIYSYCLSVYTVFRLPLRVSCSLLLHMVYRKSGLHSQSLAPKRADGRMDIIYTSGLPVPQSALRLAPQSSYLSRRASACRSRF